MSNPVNSVTVSGIARSRGSIVHWPSSRRGQPAGGKRRSVSDVQADDRPRYARQRIDDRRARQRLATRRIDDLQRLVKSRRRVRTAYGSPASRPGCVRSASARGRFAHSRRRALPPAPRCRRSCRTSTCRRADCAGVPRDSPCRSGIPRTAPSSRTRRCPAAARCAAPAPGQGRPVRRRRSRASSRVAGRAWPGGRGRRGAIGRRPHAILCAGRERHEAERQDQQRCRCCATPRGRPLRNFEPRAARAAGRSGRCAGHSAHTSRRACATDAPPRCAP